MKCLIVEDDLDFADIIRHRLRGADIIVVPTRRDALAALVARAPDVIVVDLNLPDSKAIETLEWIGELKRIAPNTSIVVATGDIRDATRASALIHGADRFLAKDATTFLTKLREIVCGHKRCPCDGNDAVEEIERRVATMAAAPFRAPPFGNSLPGVADMLRVGG